MDFLKPMTKFFVIAVKKVIIIIFCRFSHVLPFLSSPLQFRTSQKLPTMLSRIITKYTAAIIISLISNSLFSSSLLQQSILAILPCNSQFLQRDSLRHASRGRLRPSSVLTVQFCRKLWQVVVTQTPRCICVWLKCFILYSE